VSTVQPPERPAAQSPAPQSRDSRATLTLVLVLLALLVAIGALVVVLTRSGDDDGTPAAESSPTASISPSASPTPEPTPTSESTPTTEPEEPTPILLTGTGVGDIGLDTPDAQAALEALFGPASRQEPGTTECGGPENMTYLWWGDLKVSLADGALYGWGVRGNTLPADVAVVHGVAIGAPFAEVAALPGAAPAYQEAFGRVVADVDGIGYWSSEGSDVAAVTVFDITVRPVICG
jgi:hypothetical protein